MPRFIIRYERRGNIDEGLKSSDVCTFDSTSGSKANDANPSSSVGPMSTTPPVSTGFAHVAVESFEGRTLSASLTVSDLQNSLAWYSEVVGLAVEKEHEREGVLRAVSLRAGEVRILIGQDDGSKGVDRVKGAGFSLMVTTAHDIDEIARRIRERGGVIEADPVTTPWGVRKFRLKDPDGYMFVISSER